MNDDEYRTFKNGTVTGYFIHYHEHIKQSEVEEFFNHLGESLGHLAQNQKSKQYINKINNMIK